MRVRLKYVKPIRKRLASGEVATYYYHRITGKRVHGLPGTQEFAANLEAAGRLEAKVPSDSFQALILAFRNSPKFQSLRPRTRSDYEKHLAKIEAHFGGIEVEAFEDPRMRREIMTWRDELAKRSARQADYTLAVLRLTLQWACDQGWLTINRAVRTGTLYAADRSENIWSAEEIEAIMRVSDDTLRTAIRLALDTGQRQGDLLALSWTGYDGEAITLRQSKSRRRVYIPCTAELKAMIDRLPRKATTILTNRRDQPWTADGFRTMFDRAKRKAGVTERTFHDFRGTFVTRAAERQCTPQEIATITGHAISEVEKILDTYMARTQEMARSAMRKYEAGTDFGNDSGNRGKRPKLKSV